MTELPNASAPLNKEDVWEYIQNNPRILGLPISKDSGLDLLNALRDVWLEIDKNPKAAGEMLTILVSVIIAAIMGHGDEAIEEITVQDAMYNFDKQAKKMLDEG